MDEGDEAASILCSCLPNLRVYRSKALGSHAVSMEAFAMSEREFLPSTVCP